MSRSYLPLMCASLGVVSTVLFTSSACAAGPRFSARVEGGIGITDVRPLPSPSTPGAMLCAGAGVPIRFGRATLEYAVSVGDDLGLNIPEGPFSGARSLATVLLGIEAVNHVTGRGYFAAAGVGMGRATLSGATLGWQQFPSPGWSIPDRALTGLAVGVGVGARGYNGPGPLGVQIALRSHGLVAGGRLAASGTMFTLGLGY